MATHSQPKKGSVLSIDLGTSGAKAALVSSRGVVLGAAHAPVETLRLPGGGAEQDPESVWSAVKEAIVGALRSARAEPSDVLAILCASQYSSIVPVDRDGRALMGMLTWMDGRGAPERLRSIDGYPARSDSRLQQWHWLRIHGLPPVGAGLSLTHMRWIRFARPEVYERTAAFLEPMDYLAMRLCGRIAANPCTAFPSLVTDNRRLDICRYHPRLVSQSLIDEDKLPELVPMDTILGTLRPDVAAELGLSTETRVLTGLNDTQAAGIATSAFSGTHGSIVVGSSGVMITHVPFKRTDARHFILSMPSPVPDTWFVMAENGVAGGAIEHFLRTKSSDAGTTDLYEEMEKAVGESRPGSGGVLFLPWLTGSGSPRPDDRMRAGFLGIGPNTEWPDLARAVVEGVALNLHRLRRPVERFAKREFTHFVYAGGGAKTRANCQVMADVMGVPVHQLANPQYATAIGAALLAFERLGHVSFDELPSRIPTQEIFEPNAEHRGLYEDRAAVFDQAFEATQGVVHALAESATHGATL